MLGGSSSITIDLGVFCLGTVWVPVGCAGHGAVAASVGRRHRQRYHRDVHILKYDSHEAMHSVLPRTSSTDTQSPLILSLAGYPAKTQQRKQIQ